MSASAAAAPEPTSQDEIIGRYQQMTSECSQLVDKVTELEVERNEHKLVESTLQPLDPDRRAFRLVGGVLVQRTVGEVLPSVTSNRENLEKAIASLKSRLSTVQKDAAEWKAKYNIKTAEEAEKIRREQMQQAQVAAS